MMLEAIINRILQALITFVGVILLVFFLVRVLPGDPARLIAGFEARPEDVQNLRHLLGLDKPLYLQFVDYMFSLLRLDLGVSYQKGGPVINEILARLPYTAELAIVAEAIAVGAGVLLGITAGLKPRSFAGYLVSILGIIGSSFPSFLIGLFLMWVFAVQLHLLPAFGAGSIQQLILPALTLALLLTGNIARLVKSSVMESFSTNHVTTAMAKGLPDDKIIFRHILKPALSPVVTIIGIQFGSLMGGAVITETIFGWPGIGRLMVDSIFSRDFMLLQGIVVVFAVIFLVVMISVDILQNIIDPRCKMG
jgi:peptide/nickel transport system permease protein/oligopeptide transport system permease protein